MNIIFFGDSLTEGIPGVSYYNILKEKLPQHNLGNCGKGGDTVISLLRRIKKMNISQTYDIAFLWIGTNDVLVHVSKKFPLILLPGMLRFILMMRKRQVILLKLMKKGGLVLRLI